MVTNIMSVKLGSAPFRSLALALVLLSSVGAVRAQTSGCTDARALNYTPGATANDGSCVYRDTTLRPVRQTALAAALVETSGLGFVDGALYTHNDSEDARVYRVDTLTGAATEEGSLALPAPYDWEALAVLDGQVYVGDFGNNLSGNRRDLRILKLSLSELWAGDARADTLHFAYADQADFSPRPANTTDFDCEAFFVTADSVYLLTKEWTRLGTALYALPNRPGRHLARPRGRLELGGLVTDASYRPTDGTLVLSGYSNALQPFAYLLSDYPAGDFFAGNRRKLALDLPFHQVEGIATPDGRHYFVSNERFSRLIVTVPQRLSVFDLGGLLGRAPVVPTRDGSTDPIPAAPAFYPNPARERLSIDPALLPAVVMLRNAAGRVVLARRLPAGGDAALELATLPAGSYQVSIGGVARGTFVKP